jgi:hypothetical protein
MNPALVSSVRSEQFVLQLLASGGQLAPFVVVVGLCMSPAEDGVQEGQPPAAIRALGLQERLDQRLGLRQLPPLVGNPGGISEFEQLMSWHVGYLRVRVFAMAVPEVERCKFS